MLICLRSGNSRAAKAPRSIATGRCPARSGPRTPGSASPRSIAQGSPSLSGWRHRSGYGEPRSALFVGRAVDLDAPCRAVPVKPARAALNEERLLVGVFQAKEAGTQAELRHGLAHRVGGRQTDLEAHGNRHVAVEAERAGTGDELKLVLRKVVHVDLEVPLGAGPATRLGLDGPALARPLRGHEQGGAVVRLVELEVEVLVDDHFIRRLVLDQQPPALDAEPVDRGDRAVGIGDRIKEQPNAPGGLLHRRGTTRLRQRGKRGRPTGDRRRRSGRRGRHRLLRPARQFKEWFGAAAGSDRQIAVLQQNQPQLDVHDFEALRNDLCRREAGADRSRPPRAGRTGLSRRRVR